MSNRSLTILVVSVTIIWGFSWVSAKYLTAHLPLMELTFWRFIVTAIFAYIALLFFGHSSLAVPKKSILWLISGGVFMGLSQIVNFKGLELGYAGLGSIIFNATSPIFSFLLALIVFGRKIKNLEIFALVLGAFGAMVIFHFWTLEADRVFSGGNFYFLLNAFGFALVTLCSHKASQYASAGSFTVYMGVVGALLVLPFCDMTTIKSVFEMGSVFWANMLFMAGIAGGFGTTAYFFAVGKIGSAKSSGFIFLVPLSSVLGAWIAFGESVEIWSILGGALSLSAVYLLNHTTASTKETKSSTSPKSNENGGLSTGVSDHKAS